ncbi:S8 family serine peptidase [Ferrimonas marina]|uniref:S8 family serine peptidase n=1 Tax=Ferrimonas marina TaxID=299255 RepID=UPI0009E7C3A8|nr:S8 family serine peptidase [Ferrimonas marina]
MKIKQLTLMTLAALYAAGSASASGQAQGGTEFRSIEITDSIIKLNSDLREGRHRSGAQVNAPRNSNGTNVHRGIALTGEDKIPFRYEQGLTGQHTYIVELSDAPAASYRGGIAGLQATAPQHQSTPFALNAHGANKLQVQTQAVQSYRQYLSDKQDAVLSQISSSRMPSSVKGRYTLAFNGMAVTMSQDEAARIATLPGVRAVHREEVYELNTDVGPEHIGANQLWDGTVGDAQYRGEGMVIGVLDTGINSDHPSFAEVAGDGYQHTNPLGSGVFLGDCEAAEFRSMCNDKLIGIRSYEVITDSYSDPIFQDAQPWQVVPPKRPANGEDYQGHGSHTASTAAGNVLYDVDYLAPEFAEQSDGVPTGLVFPMVSGVAPRANIIAYQVCWASDASYGDGYRGCPGSALLSGIEDAIADGVDAINYSIGTTFGGFPWEHPVEMAFLRAREAGISVSASAGNSYSPAYSNEARGAIDHLSPWLTSVAATTHGREIKVDKSLTAATGGDEPMSDISGGGITGSYTGPLVDAKAYGSEYEKCNDAFPADFFALDPEGNPWPGDIAPIVICKRGDIARVTKAVNIAAGGAGGLILRNANSTESINNDAFAIPGIHISYGDYFGDNSNGYFGLDDWLKEGTGHTITISESNVYTEMGQANYVADFSSRGPNLENPDVMSPNVAAPGVNVYAAYADDMPFTRAPLPTDFAAISGTSMAAPHVAGAMLLLQQAHPDWTPAQIQSALMTTASLDGVTRSRDGYPYDPVAAGYADAGAGVINVARATAVGLVLDETGDNYRAANPRNGGSVTTLNLPYLYNDQCAGTCTFMRTFTATTSGTWDVSAEALEIPGAPMLDIQVSPQQFSLMAGESQAIMVTAKVLDVEALGNDSSSLQLLGRVNLDPLHHSLPTQHLPVGVRYSGDTLPREVSGVIHRESGHTLTPMVYTDEIQSFNYRVNGLVKADRHDLMLSRADTRINEGHNTMAEVMADPGSKVIFFDVPEGSERIVVEVQHVDKVAYSGIDMGMDVNNDGDIQWWDEAICYSWTDAGDFCAVNDPMPGTYWAVVGNWKYDYEDPKNGEDSVVLNIAVVTGDNGDNLEVSGPASNNGMDPYQLRLNYNLPGAQDNDTYYGVVSLGSDVYNDDNLGSFALKLEHMGSDTSITASQTAAKAGDIVDFHVRLEPNLLGAERGFSLVTQLPDTLDLVPGSLTVGSVGIDAEDVSISGNVLTLDAVQPSSAQMGRHYSYTTNHDDPMCRVPYGSDPAFFDLFAQGFQPMSGLEGLPNQMLWIPMAENGLPHVPLYANPEEFAQDVLAISPFGYVQFDWMMDFWNQNIPFTDIFQTFPDTMVAPLWRGDVSMPSRTTDWDTFRPLHAVYAVVTDKHYLFQWEGGQENMSFFGGNTNPDSDAFFNIQTIISTEINFEPGDYEMIFAYDAINTFNNHLGSVGLHGYWGERGAFGPTFGYLNDGFAFEDVDQKISNGTVVCADYRGPEQTGVDLKFQARVSAEATGQLGVITVESQYDDSELVTVEHNLDVPSNITVADIADQVTDENTPVEGLSVMYNDLKGTANAIEISGEHVTVELEGNESGAQFSLTPDLNWHGTTEVTVTVYDMAYPTDRASTSFMLTVNNIPSLPEVSLANSYIAMNAGETLMLDASGSVDPEGGELSFEWEHTTGPSGHMSGAMSATPTVTDLGYGYHEFTVTVTNATGSVSKVVTVMVNGAPQVEIAPESVTVAEGSTISISAAGTVDPDGDAMTYFWEVVSGFATLQGANTSQVTLLGLSAGEVVIEVRVSDGKTTSIKQAVVTVVEADDVDEQDQQVPDAEQGNGDTTAPAEEEGNSPAPESDQGNSSNASNSGTGSSNTTATPEAAEQGASGGSLGYALLMLLALAGLRRRR